MQYLVISTNLPFNNQQAKESLDLVLTLSTFDQEVQLLFIDQGVMQLVKKQNPKKMYKKNFLATFKAMELYDIKIFADYDSTLQYNLSSNDLLDYVIIVDKKFSEKLIQISDYIVNI